MDQENSENNGETLQAFYGPLQRLILGVVVKAEEPISAKAVRNRLEESGTDRAQSTISTELNRLTEKEIIERSRDEYPGGFRYLYTPVDEFEDKYLEGHFAAIQEVLGEESLLTICELIRQQSQESEVDLCNELHCL